MNSLWKVAVPTLLLIAALGISSAWAVPGKGDVAPSFAAEDIFGNKVDLTKIVEESPDMVILYFFTTDSGQEMAVRLSAVDALYGRDKVRIIAFGVKEDKKALSKFAADLGIEYYILTDEPVESLYGPYAGLPLTFILKNDKTIVKVVRGSGETAGAILTQVAETYLMQGKSEEAVTVANIAQQKGEDATKATEVRGYAYTVGGKLDEAEKEFGLIGYEEGKARVALERGEYDKAIDLANQAGGSGYAETIKAMAYMRTGKLDEAAATFESATKKPAADWQASEALTGQGRVLQEKGATGDAVTKYDAAVALDPFNVVALSNEGAAYRAEGNLEKASEALEKAKAVREDDLVVCMLKQIKDEMEKANDVKHGELIRQQIADLANRYKEMKAAGTDKPADAWSSRPLVLAFLPSSNKTPVFFERAGADVVLRRELEGQVQAGGAVSVVEREMLDKLLQELNLGSSEVANPDTQLQLGKVLSAQYLGFIDFAQAGQDILMYLRLVDTETTAIAHQLMRNIKNESIPAVAQGLAKEMIAKIKEERELRGLIADTVSDSEVIINLGKAHGIAPGQRFTILVEGAPIEVGGRVIGHRPKPVGLLEVTAVEDTYSTCKVVQKDEGVQLAKEMKVKAAKAQ
jgi:tetratricopeptide (TPR) repeat protein